MSLELIFANFGKDVEWLQLQPDGKHVSKGKIRAVIQPASPDEFLLEPGYALMDYAKVYTEAEISHRDRLVFDDKTWEVVAPWRYDYESLGIKITQAIVRRLLT